MTHEEWPKSDIEYAPTKNDADEARWQNAITASLSAGRLRLDPTDNIHRYILSGKCPRCDHDIGERKLNFRRLGFNEYAPDDSYEVLAIARIAAGVVGVDRPSFNIVCRCTHRHKPRPNGEYGCGWSSDATVYIDDPRGGDGG